MQFRAAAETTRADRGKPEAPEPGEQLPLKRQSLPLVLRGSQHFSAAGLQALEQKFRTHSEARQDTGWSGEPPYWTVLGIDSDLLTRNLRPK